jgi:hypothetical protein
LLRCDGRRQGSVRSRRRASVIDIVQVKLAPSFTSWRRKKTQAEKSTKVSDEKGGAD